MWDLISVGLMYVKKQKGYVPHLLLLVCAALFIGGAIFSLQHDYRTSNHSAIDLPESDQKPLYYQNKKTAPLLDDRKIPPEVESIKSNNDAIHQAIEINSPEANSEPIPHFSTLNHYLTQSLVAQGYDEGISRNLMDRIRQNLINEDGGEARLIQTIKEELPGASDDEVHKVQSAISEALGKIAEENKNKPGYPQPGPPGDS